MDTPVLQISNLTKSFSSSWREKTTVVQNLSLQLAKNEVFGFLGPNGAGKSTTIKMMMRFMHPDEGEILINQQNIKSGKFRQTTGYLPEFPHFYEHLTAFETLQLSGNLSGVPQKELKPRISRLLDRMNLAEATHKRIAGFSKGMKQRLGMANALVHDPKFLIFDEPMSGLDPLGRNLLKMIITELKSEGKTIFFSSHILSDIEQLCDGVGIIHKGKLLYNGTVSEISDSSENLETAFVKIIKTYEQTASH